MRFVIWTSILFIIYLFGYTYHISVVLLCGLLQVFFFVFGNILGISNRNLSWVHGGWGQIVLIPLSMIMAYILYVNTPLVKSVDKKKQDETKTHNDILSKEPLNI